MFGIQHHQSGFYFSNVREVEYVPDYPILRMFSDSAEGKMRKFMLTKSDDWFYEREWRVFEIMEDGFTRTPGGYDFPPDPLTGIIFGCRMTDAQIRNVSSWLDKMDPGPRRYRACVKHREFGVQIDPMDV